MRNTSKNPLIAVIALCAISLIAAALLFALLSSGEEANPDSSARTASIIVLAASACFFTFFVLLAVRRARRRKQSEAPAEGSVPKESDRSTAAAILADILRALPCSILIVEPDGTVRVAYNCERFSRAPQPLGANIVDVFPPDMLDADALIRILTESAAGKTVRQENLVARADGKETRYDLVASPLGPEGGHYGALFLLEDVTSQWELNRRLGESRDFLKNIIQRSPASMCVFSRDGAAIMVNDAYLKLFRRQRAELLGRYNIFEDPLYLRQGFLPDIQKAFNGDVVALPPVTVNLSTLGRRAAGETDSIAVQGVLFPLFGPEGAVSNVILMHQDLTELKRAESEVRFLSEYNQRILDGMGAGVRVIDYDLNVEFRNDYMRDAIEKKPAERCFDFLGRREPCEPCAVRRAIERGEVAFNEYSSANGRIFTYVAAPITGRDGKKCAVGVIREITENRRLEQQILQQEKLSTLGMMAGGIAHEINNPLGVISMYLQMLSECRDNPQEIEKHVSVINRNVENCRKIIQGLLTFARKQPLNKQRIDINKCVDEAVALCSHLVKKGGVALNENLEAGGLPIVGDPVQLQQVFVNLITNAVQAMPGGGTLSIRTGSRLDPSGMRHLFVEIRDTGIGMSPEVLEKVFDPFFSTKPPGEGTGLGLAVSRSIVETHDGRITAESVEGKGSLFTVLLPASAERRAEPSPPENASPRRKESL